MSNLFARSIARLVGAPTPINKPILVIKTFWTNSKFRRPEHVINWSFGSRWLFTSESPINLSKALCLPTSSLREIKLPFDENNPLACIPPVFENSAWLFLRAEGEFDNYPDIEISKSIDFEVWGVVTHTIHNHRWSH